LKKLLAVGVIVLFLGLAIAPSTGNRMFNDDTTPPVTTCTLDPPEPDGDNGWYVNDVNVTLNATDDMSGVKEIRYRRGSGSWQTIVGDNGTFIMDIDGDDFPIEYYAIDNAGNEETHQIVTIDMDQTIPDIEEVQWEAFKEGGDFYVTFTCDAMDATSGMDRVEMYINDVFLDEIVDAGPTYEFTIEWSEEFKTATFWFYHYDKAENVIEAYLLSNPPIPVLLFITGIILNPEISEEEVTFFTLMTISSDGIYMYERLTFPNDYDGYIGRFFICAIFHIWV